MTDYPLTANAALYDRKQVEAYISCLFRHVDWNEGEVVSLLGIGEKGTPKEGLFRERKFIPPAFMGSVHTHLERWAQWHAAGFIVPAVIKDAAVNAHDVTLDKLAALTAIIVDLDSGDTEAKRQFVTERLGTPSMVIASGGQTESGKPKLHIYWLFNEPEEDVERVAAIRKLLAVKVGGDPSFGRATQVIRVAGSVHAKNGKASRCELLERTDAEYSFDDLADIIEEMLPMEGIDPPASEPTLPLKKSDGLMDFTPNFDTAVAALHRDINEGGTDLTRWGEFNKVAGFYIAEARGGRMALEDAFIAANGWMLEHMNPPWPQARFDTEFKALVDQDVKEKGPFPAHIPSPIAAAATQPAFIAPIEPTPATFPYPASIPPRPWLFGRWFMRGIVTAVIAPGGVGKSSLMAGVSLSMASGVPFLGKTIYGGPLKCWLWNLEDSKDNLARARVAASMHHRIQEEAVAGRLFVDSGPEGATLCTAVEDRHGFTIIEPVMENITAALTRLGIDTLIIDPFVSSHQVSENDNNKIDAVAKRWARVAIDTNCSIVLVHHTAKLHGDKVTADAARGAGALNNAARMTLVLNRMTEEEAEGWGIEPGQNKRFFSVVDDKHNLTAADKADWFELVSINLGNGTDIYEPDSVGVVTSWQPPSAMDGVQGYHLFQVQRVLHGGTYWKDIQSTENWAGEVVAEIVGIDCVEVKGRRRIKKILDAWEKSGAIKPESVRDEKKRKPRLAYKVGNWAADPAGPMATIPDAFPNYYSKENPTNG